MTTPKSPLPISFGSPERRLIGIYHPSQSPTVTNRPAVVLCNAFGQEAIRAHRFLRTLAERVARAGHPVLRFDYFGTGDSMGDDADGDMAGWSQDLHTAHQELRHRANASSIVWIGMRLGGTVALQAARTAPRDLAKLILWDPVLDGPRYLSLLRDRHVESLESVYSLPLKPTPHRLAENPAAYRDEAIGFALSQTLRAQLSMLLPEHHRWPIAPERIVVVTDPDSVDGKDFAAIGLRNPGRVSAIQVKHGTHWTTDNAANTSLVPTAALMTITQQVGETQ